MRTTRDLLASAPQSADVAEGRYKAGVGSILDLLTAQAALADARAQEVAGALVLVPRDGAARARDRRPAPGAPEIRALPRDEEELHDAHRLGATPRRPRPRWRPRSAARRRQGAAAEAVPVRVGTVVQKAVPLQIRNVGTVQPYVAVAVRAQVTGEIMQVHFREGQDLSKGELLFSIDPRPYEAALAQAEAALARDRAQMENAQTDVQRYEDLVKGEVVGAVC